MKRIMIAGVALAAMAPMAWAAEVTAKQAELAAKNWINRDPHRLNASFRSANAEDVATAYGASGRVLYHVVQLDGGGFVVTAGDTRLTPVVAFSDEGCYVAGRESALYAILQADQARALAIVDEYEARAAASPVSKGANVFAKAEAQWASLLNGAVQPKRLGTAPSYPRVDKLLKTVWGQRFWGGIEGNPEVFNYSTPNNYVSGCVATLGAQIMKYWEWPTAALEQFSNLCRIDDTAVTRYSISGAFNWANMPLSIATQPNPTTVQKQAIGMLMYNVGVAVGMNWTSDGSAASLSSMPSALKNRFGYSSATYVNCSLAVGDSSDWTSFRDALYSNLDAGMPVGLSVSKTGNVGGHVVIADGYGYSSGTCYTHINMGWAGIDDAWYNLMDENLPAPNDAVYSVFNGMLINVHPSTVGDVLSGRVTTAAGTEVPGAAVMLLDSSKNKLQDTISGEHGIYSFRITSAGQYYVRATFGTANSLDMSANISSLSSSWSPGCKWGVSPALGSGTAGTDVWDPADDTASGGTWLTPTTATQTHGSHTLSSSDEYDFFRISMKAGRTYVFASTGTWSTTADLYSATAIDADHCVASASDNDGNGNFRLEFTPNTSQTYYLRISSDYNGRNPNYSLDYSYEEYNPGTYLRVEGFYPDVYCTLGSDAVNFMSSVDCDGDWTVSVDNAPWVDLWTTSGTGSGYFYFSLPQNEGYDRSCVFTVTSGSLTARKHLTQYGPKGVRPTSVSVTFNAQGGKFSNGASTKTVTAKPDNLWGKMPVPSMSGQVFDGWYTEQARGELVTASDKVPDYSTTYYATWTPRLGLAAASEWPYAFTTDSWCGQETVAHDGSDALRSGIIYDGQSSYLQTKVTGPGTLTFWWAVSCEGGGNDKLRFLVDGVQQQMISGEIYWRKVTANIAGDGTHTLKWVYSKNGSVTKGEDYGWLDELKWTPATPSGIDVVFDAQGGKFSNGATTKTAYGVKPGNLWGKMYMPAKDGQVFVGWYTAKSGGTQVVASSTVPSAATTYYARWTPRLGLAAASEWPYAFTTDSWCGQGAVSHDGNDALRSGIIYDGQNSYLQTKVTGAGTLTFWWKVSSESGNDALRFLVDGVQKQVISGEKDWAKVTLSITGSGEHRLKWNYVKNGSVTKGEDFGWLDQITWTGK